MKRETSNILRTILEDWIPPVIRDSGLFRWLFRLAQGDAIDRMAELRRRAPYLSDAEIADFYRNAPRIHDETDNSKAVLDAVAEHCEPGAILDVGCGTGYTLKFLKTQPHLQGSTFTGVEIAPPEPAEDISFVTGDVRKLQFADASFDTVICTHVLEHVLDFRAALAELRRVTKTRLIIVVPREREYLYNFNPHFHFFPYTHALLRYMIPLPDEHRCLLIGRDILYVEGVDSN